MDELKLTLREAVFSDRLEDFIREEVTHGVELSKGSEFERALALLVTQHVSKRQPNARLKWRRHMKKSFAAYTAAVAFIALAVFVPTNASAQVNIYVGPGGYAHYGYGYGYPRITDTAMATILTTATAIMADIEATTVAIGAMGVG